MALRRFPRTRSLWLIALEPTVVGFAWSFRPARRRVLVGAGR